MQTGWAVGTGGKTAKAGALPIFTWRSADIVGRVWWRCRRWQGDTTGGHSPCPSARMWLSRMSISVSPMASCYRRTHRMRQEHHTQCDRRPPETCCWHRFQRWSAGARDPERHRLLVPAGCIASVEDRDQNVELGPMFKGVGAAERRKRSMRWLAQVGLKGFEHRNPHQLSGGQRKRVQMAQSLITGHRDFGRSKIIRETNLIYVDTNH